MAGNRVSVVTVLAHSSGEWVSAELALPITDPGDARSLASAVTYARRYGLIALVGVAPADEDDDGDGAVASKVSRPKQEPVTNSSGPEPHGTGTDRGRLHQRRSNAGDLFAIAKAGGWDKDALHAWLIQEGIGSTTKIKINEYDAVVAQLQRAAP